LTKPSEVNADPASAETGGHPFGAASQPGGPVVLLVDDDEVNLLLTSFALGERGFKVTAASS
jgi:PleD family two-component response regulator